MASVIRAFRPQLLVVTILIVLITSLLFLTSEAQSYTGPQFSNQLLGATQLVDTPGGAGRADIVVAKDGSGDFVTVQAALNAVRSGTPSRWSVVFIKGGVYTERVVMNESLHHVMLVGANARKGNRAKITFAKSMAPGRGLDESATFRLLASDVIVWNVVFENAFGPGSPGGRAEQALAIQVEGTRVAFYGCTFLGYQDTLYAANGLQYYRNCAIFGRMDFIFGNAKAVFDRCSFRLVYWGGAYFAQAREVGEDTGFVVWGGSLTPYGKGPIRPGFLARAWGKQSTVVFVKTYFDVGSVREEGWSYVSGFSNTQNAIFGAYQCFGPGYNSSVWENNGREMSAAEVAPYTSSNYINRDKWIVINPLDLMAPSGTNVGAARDPNSPSQSYGARGQRKARGSGTDGAARVKGASGKSHSSKGSGTGGAKGGSNTKPNDSASSGKAGSGSKGSKSSNGKSGSSGSGTASKSRSNTKGASSA